MEDSAIVALYWARDEQAIRQSDRKYGALCRSLSKNLLGSREDAEECVQDTWYRAWVTMPPKRPQLLKAYLCCIVRNLSVDRWRAGRAKKRGGALAQLSLELEDCAGSEKTPEAAWEDRQITRCIERWLQTLGQENRDLFLQRYWFGCPLARLAHDWGMNENQLAQRLYRLRQGLRRALEEEGVALRAGRVSGCWPVSASWTRGWCKGRPPAGGWLLRRRWRWGFLPRPFWARQAGWEAPCRAGRGRRRAQRRVKALPPHRRGSPPAPRPRPVAGGAEPLGAGALLVRP